MGSRAWLGLVVLFVGCSSPSGYDPGADPDAGSSKLPSADGGGNGGKDGAPQQGGDAATNADSGSPPQGLQSVGSLVVLGDSMSDGGGQPPFYYNLLRADLDKLYGTVQYANNAQSGSQTGALSGQIDALPKSLKAPVAVCITSGGNDMKAALPLILLGTDGAVRAQMGANIQAALSKLLAPNRFGANVDVHVFEANIYDASDGKGDFGSHGCAFGKGMPATPTDGFFKSWNGEIATQVSAKGQTVNDIHAHFYGHGYSGNPSWYWSDCTHPNALGHDQLRRRFYTLITGKVLQ